MFDTAVNSGVSRAKTFLKECSGDWKYYLLIRIVFCSKCKTEKFHLRGWTKRIAKLYDLINKEEK